MKKTLRSLLAYFLAAMLLVQSAPSAFAESTMPSVTVVDTTCTAGNSVTVIVTGKNFENLGTLPIEFYYDADILTLNTVSIGSDFQTYFHDINISTPGKAVVNLVYEDERTVSSATLLYLSFTVAADATAGKTEIAVAVGDARNGEFAPITVSSNSGKLTINEKPVQLVPLRLSASTNTSTLSKGDTVTLQVNNNRSVSVTGGTFRVSFDDALFRVKNAAFTSGLSSGECLTDINVGVLGQVTLSFISDTATTFYPLFSVELEAIADVDTTTSLTYAVIEAYDANNVAYDTYSGSTQVTLTKLPEVVDYPDFSVNSTEFVVGEGSTSTLMLEASDVAAADFVLHFDPEVLEVASVENISTVTDSKAYVMIDETTWDTGSVCFTYINTAGTAQDLPLVKINWNVLSAKADAALTLSGSGVVDINLKDVALEYIGETAPVYTVETISFNANGGSGTMADQTVRSGTELTLNANTFTRVDYTFNGWNTKADGTGTAYADKANITATNATTLYAQWEIAEAHWGLATGEELDELPSEWESWGALTEAMAYANGRSSGEVAYIQLLSDADTTAPLVFASDKTTILDLNGKTIDRGLKEATIDGYVIKVNGTLTLCDASENVTSTPGRITGGYSHYDGGGVFVDDGTFIMSGGNITENTVEGTYYCGGGGVSVKGTFTLNGGSISKNNTAGIDSSGGGVYVYSNSIFTMNGGTITGNTASRSGGGLYTSMCTFIMNGGSISRNTTSVNGGGGVYASGTSFTMNDGYIVGNIAADSPGGGVRSSGSSFTMNGGSIAENTASSGGGVYVENLANSFTMNGGSISGNTALFGGGVDVSGLFTLNGGSIFGNAASYQGGGVFVLYCGTFIMSGGIISGNTATNDGGGVMVDGSFVGSGYNPVAWSEGVIQLSGKSVVFGNVKNGTLNETSGLYELGRGGSVNNVSLRSKGPIIVTRGLDDNASIGVTTASEPTNDAPITVAQGGGDSAYTLTANDATKFTSDSGYDVVFDSANNRVCLEFSLLLGDVNSDGTIDIGDHQRLFEHLQGINIITDNAVLIAADVNKDGTIDIGDHQRLFEHLQGINLLS